ncbi:MAG: hypothetical protein JXO51_04645 [Candidatus Aminicenantes bacterium]|nr:hypothetical protein [Candidatus Aminicenantes bacterium]
MSVILKHLYLLRLRWLRIARNILRRRVPGRLELFLKGEHTPLPFCTGANLPWLRYGGDFGANAWSPGGGVARAGERERLRRHLRELKGRGLDVVRWFLLCDGRAGIRFTPSGTPLGPGERLCADIDAALEELAAAGMKAVFVLLDFRWFSKAVQINGVQVGGRGKVITNAYKQQRFRRRVLCPLFARCGRSPQILAWDIVNEPEWVTRGWGGGLRGPSVSFLAMRRFIRRTARLVHRHTGHLATVGLGNASGLPLVRGCGLDFYQVHWYERWQESVPLERPVRDLDLDRPLLLGEFPTKNASRTPEEIVAAARSSGYCGALAWSWLAQDGFSGIRDFSS